MISVLVAALLVAAPAADTIFTVDGGRVTGTVLEESATSGVTVQMPDGSIRKIERTQVSRIEFADGTVSAPRPPAPPPQAAPAPRAAEGALDKVFFRGGGRARGSVMEESASGVKIRLLDGSIRTYASDELTRIEYADGTVSAPGTARAPEPASPPRTRSTEPPVDTAFFLGGGRVRGTVIEENPRTGVRIRLLDGTVQSYPRDDLVRIEYADGSASHRVTAAPAPAAPPPQPPPPVAPPVAAPPPHEVHRPHALPLYLTLGLGATFLGGDAAQNVPMGYVMEKGQAHVSSEFALRLTPAFAVGVYGDVGGGEPTRAVREQCAAAGDSCSGTTGRVGFLVRYTWDPLSTRPVWLSLGTGWEMGAVTIDNPSGGNGSDHRDELFKYTGREHARLGLGVDFRSNRVFGFGLYGSVAVGEYDQYKDAVVTTAVDSALHVTAQVGARLILFP